MFGIIANLEIKRNLEYIKEIKNFLNEKNINCKIATVHQDWFNNYIYNFRKYVLKLIIVAFVTIF